MEMFLYFVVSIVWCVIWGIATQKVIYNKGYDDDWFIWGFLFGIIAFLVAPTKADRPRQSRNSSGSLSRLSEYEEIRKKKQQGYWPCSCGQLNPPYVTTCPCGLSAKQVKERNERAENEKKESEKKRSELENLNLLTKYKEMLDAGIISEEEFAAKKKELLK